MSDILYFINPSNPVKTSSISLSGRQRNTTQLRTETLSSVSGYLNTYNDRFIEETTTSSRSVGSDLSLNSLYATRLGYSIASGVDYNNGFRSGNYTLNWNNSNLQTLILSGNTTLTLSGATEGSRLQLIVKQDSVGSRTITWPSTVKWSMGGVPPVLTTTQSGIDMVCLYYKDGLYYSTSATTFL